MANPLWKPGVSGNPSGRPKSAARIARVIRRETQEGSELAEFYLKLFRDEDQPIGIRMRSAEWLTDRGFGKPQVSIDLTVDGDGPTALDASRILASLSIAALAEIVAAQQQLLAAQEAEAVEAAIDVTPAPALEAKNEEPAQDSQDAETGDQPTPGEDPQNHQ